MGTNPRSGAQRNSGSGTGLAQETKHILQSNAKALKSDVSRYAVYGVLIAFSAIIIATLLLSHIETGSISLSGAINVQKSNVALWGLDLMPFVFAMWGQYVGSMISYEASALVIDQTNELRAQTTALRNQAAHGVTHDPLTGLPNRTLVMDRIDQAIAVAHSKKQTLSVMLLDIDHFSELNSALSRHQGDQALNQVAGRLRGLARDTDTVARVGADEFVILVARASSELDTHRIATSVMTALKAPFVLDGVKVGIQASMGVTIYPNHGADGDTLLQRAEVAMYAAKRDKSGFAVYNSKYEKNSPRRITLAGELREALEYGSLYLQYQPKMLLKTAELNGVEALARWPHPVHTEISPGEFISLAERTGLIRPLTSWVVNQALQQLSTWGKQGFLPSVSINISAQDLNNEDLFDHLTGLLASYGIDPKRIVLEITETSIMLNEEHAASMLKRLADIGIRLSIDDFGTGYSSLAHLSELPIYEIKIDRSFVEDMNRNPKHAKIVRAIIDLAHNLELKVTAEGVWCSEIKGMLEALGCDAIQGFYVSTPITAEDVPNWRSANKTRIADSDSAEQTTADKTLSVI